MAWGAVWDRFFQKELGIRVRPTAEKSKNGGNRASARGIGHLLVQNRSQEVQEHSGARGKAENPQEKLKINDFWVSGVSGGFSPYFCYTLPLKDRSLFGAVWGHPLCSFESGDSNPGDTRPLYMTISGSPRDPAPCPRIIC